MWLTEPLPKVYLRPLSGVVVAHAGQPLRAVQGGVWQDVSAKGHHRSKGPEVEIQKPNAHMCKIDLLWSKSLWLQDKEQWHLDRTTPHAISS